ncbi:MAG: hypothetical protein M3T49_04755 [Candidatus Eremiobacteraeota bacterium]|nr:hypothetical protein [Candidatus Eremiobacteraeota bacterium]
MYRIILAMLLLGMMTAKTPASTTMPGGANQIVGVSGGMNKTLFNGLIRWKMTTIREALPSDRLGDPHQGMRWLVFLARCSNGSHSTYIGVPQLTLTDAQDNSYHSADSNTSPAPVDVIQGQPWQERMAVEVPPEFVPLKAVITDPSNASRFKAFRIAITSKDLPNSEPPSPTPSASP